MKRSLATARAWLLSVLLTSPAMAGVTASVDRGVVSLSETFELRLRVNGAMNAEEPELAVLQKDFEILSTSRNHRISLMQGQREAYTEWVVVLLARQGGAQRIPAIRVGDEASEPIDITVREGRVSGSTPSGEVSIDVVADVGTVHVQQQLLVTVRLMHAVNLASGAALDELEIPGAVVRKLEEGSHEKIIDGRRFGVFERRYAVFPQKSGELVVPALRFSGSTGGDSWFDRFDSGGRRYRLQSTERTIRVLPPEQGASPWIPARNLSIVETWDRDPEALRVGESATRSITLTAEGLTGAQIPPMPEASVEGLRFYADKPAVSDAVTATGITGTRVQRIAVIPGKAGELAFPEVRVRWWDSVQGRFDEAVVPARTLRVLPAARSSTPAPVTSTPAPTTAGKAAPAAPPGLPQDPGQTALPRVSPWMISTFASLLLAAFFAVQWLRARRRSGVTSAAPPVSADDEPRAFARLQETCRSMDAAAAIEALMAWARAAFPDVKLRSPAALGDLTGDPAFRAAIDALMASRYAEHRAGWDGSGLSEVASRHRPGGERRSMPDERLPGLYAFKS